MGCEHKEADKTAGSVSAYILLGLVATNFGEAWRLAEGKELGERIMSMMGTLPLHLRTRFPVCTRWICLLAFPAVQDYGLPYTCEAKRQEIPTRHGVRLCSVGYCQGH